MGIVSLTIAVAALALEASLLWRAWEKVLVRRFPLFYSYLTYVFLASVVTLGIYYAYPRQYPSAYWFCYVVWLIAEFAVLLEASDHIFEPYPSVRRLGRLLTACICLIFFLAIILPVFFQHRSRPLALLELNRTAALTKSFLILVLIAAARLYQLPLGKNIAGMLLGFVTYLVTTVGNMAAAETLGPGRYRGTLAVVGPVGFVVALTIWSLALWQYEPVRPARQVGRLEQAPRSGLEELGRYNAELMRLFRR